VLYERNLVPAGRSFKSASPDQTRLVDAAITGTRLLSPVAAYS